MFELRRLTAEKMTVLDDPSRLGRVSSLCAKGIAFEEGKSSEGVVSGTARRGKVWWFNQSGPLRGVVP